MSLSPYVPPPAGKLPNFNFRLLNFKENFLLIQEIAQVPHCSEGQKGIGEIQKGLGKAQRLQKPKVEDPDKVDQPVFAAIKLYRSRQT